MDKSTKRKYVIGIDLGTSNSNAAVIIDGKVVTISAKEGPTIYGKSTPSYVYFRPEGGIDVGLNAKNKAIVDSSRAIYEFKRKIGTDTIYHIDTNEGHYHLTPEEVSAHLLTKIKEDAQLMLNGIVEQVVITCPAYFKDAQKNATRDAARLAKLQPLRLIPEPTAAALSTDLENLQEGSKLLVFDIGGGTLDVSVLIYEDKTLEVKGLGGDVECGGMDIDRALIAHVVKNFEAKTGLTLADNPDAYERVRNEVELAKIKLSSEKIVNISLPYLLWNKEGKPVHLEDSISRVVVRQLVQHLIPKFDKAVDEALQYAGYSAKDINKILLVGGPSKMQFIREYVVNKIGDVIDESISPSDCVAIGAAKQAAILAGQSSDILLLDVTPLTLGIEVSTGSVEPIIEKNSSIPVKKSKIFSTVTDNQSNVEIRILEGQRPRASDNHELGVFKLDGIPPAKAGEPKIEVTFDINRDGLLIVTAKETSSNVQQSLKIVQKGKLSDEDIKRMIEDAQKFKQQDKLFIQETTVKAQSKDLIAQSASLIAEDTTTPEDKDNLEKLKKDLETALMNNNLDVITECKNVLLDAVSKVFAKKYQGSKTSQSDTHSQDTSGN